MQLRKATDNTNVALTLVEETTLSNPYYLFEFQNDTTLVKYFQIFTDVSVAGAARTRANLFNIEVVVSGAGAEQIVLGNIGQYNYTIYEQTSSSNLDPDLVTGIVERGRMRLIDGEVSIYIEHTIDVTYIAHEQ